MELDPNVGGLDRTARAVLGALLALVTLGLFAGGGDGSPWLRSSAAPAWRSTR